MGEYSFRLMAEYPTEMKICRDWIRIKCFFSSNCDMTDVSALSKLCRMLEQQQTLLPFFMHWYYDSGTLSRGCGKNFANVCERCARQTISRLHEQLSSLEFYFLNDNDKPINPLFTQWQRHELQYELGTLDTERWTLNTHSAWKVFIYQTVGHRLCMKTQKKQQQSDTFTKSSKVTVLTCASSILHCNLSSFCFSFELFIFNIFFNNAHEMHEIANEIQ